MSNAPTSAIRVEIELRWSDQDLLGHVNNAKIMTLLEEARIRALEDLRRRANWEGTIETVVRTAHTEFIRPVVYTGETVVNVWISRLGNSSYVLQHELVQDGEVCVTLEAVMVAFDSQTQTSTPIPAPLRVAFESIQS